jgi:hypothetical protein
MYPQNILTNIRVDRLVINGIIICMMHEYCENFQLQIKDKVKSGFKNRSADLIS